MEKNLNREVFYKTAFSSVDQNLFKTRKQTYRINNIEKTEIKRVFFYYAFPICLLISLFAFNFWEYLYDNEKTIIIAGVVSLTVISWNIGVLYVHSKALREAAMMGTVWKLRRLRYALDEAMHYGVRGVQADILDE